MKPEITIQDFGGAHNGDMARSYSRIVKGGSWKKQRIILLIPAADKIPAKVALSLMNLIFPPNNAVARIIAQGCEVGHAYSATIEAILQDQNLKEFEFLLCAEHDNLPPQDGALKLIEAMEEHPELAAIGGLYWTKGAGGCAQIWGDTKDPILNFRPQPPDPNGGLVECCGLGQGFTMFRLKTFRDERLRKPWFQTLQGASGVSTQDLAFWSDARKFGYRCACHCGIKVGHMDESGMVW